MGTACEKWCFKMNKQNAENPFLSFYGKNSISPVRQDLSDINIHLTRRGNLYRILGLPAILFQDRQVLEVGPGGGHNALALFFWGAKVDFVEPNLTAQKEMKHLFESYQIASERWSLFPGLVEDFFPGQLYDVVIAEGFIPGLYQRDKVITKLRGLVKPGGVIVVTCFDEISSFFDVLKRAVAYYLAAKVEDFGEKVSLLCHAFEPHLKALRYVSRPTEDWVKDMLLNPAVFGKTFSISDCIEEFGTDFKLLGSSPAMFTNYQWYKDIDFDLSQSVLQQFQTKRHILLLWDLPESIRTVNENRVLLELAIQIRDLIIALEKNHDTDDILMEIILKLKEFNRIINNIDSGISMIINEVIELLQDKNITPEKVARANHFARAFGRGQQYISLQKRFSQA